jgi:hypothetical protein
MAKRRPLRRLRKEVPEAVRKCTRLARNRTTERYGTSPLTAEHREAYFADVFSACLGKPMTRNQARALFEESYGTSAPRSSDIGIRSLAGTKRRKPAAKRRSK